MSTTFVLYSGSIIARVTAIDPEGGPIIYSLSGRAAEYLEINATSGEIRIKVQLDFERDPVCWFVCLFLRTFCLFQSV